MTALGRVLITGAAGFVGGETVRQFRDAGFDVISTDRRGDVDLVGDLADADFTGRLPSVDAVVHCAAVQYVSPDLPLLYRKAWFDRHNVQATNRLCERYGREPRTHFVNVGTSMMYEQNGSQVYRISSTMQAQGVYSRSKLAAFRHVCAMPNPTATIVPCIVGGIGREGLFRKFVSMAMRRGRVAFPGTGRHPTHMVHVQDVASLLLAVVARQAVGLFNAAGPGPLGLNDWVAQIGRALNLPALDIVHLPLAPVRALSAISGYRLLAAEQLSMLKHPHVLDTAESLALGWVPRHDNAAIVSDIAKYVAATSVRLR